MKNLKISAFLIAIIVIFYCFFNPLLADKNKPADTTKSKSGNGGKYVGTTMHLIVPPGAGKNGDKYLTAVEHLILSPGWQKISKNNPQENGTIDLGSLKKGVYYFAVDMNALRNIPNEKMKELNHGGLPEGATFDATTSKLRINFIKDKNQVRCVYGNCVYAWVLPNLAGVKYEACEINGNYKEALRYYKEKLQLVKIIVEKEVKMPPLYFHAVNNFGIDKTGTMRTNPSKEEIDKFLKGE